MNKLLKLTSFFALALIVSCSKPSAKDILKKTHETCQSVENGYYEVLFTVKYPTQKDTIKSNINCYFSRQSSDTIFSFLFNYEHFYELYAESRSVLYTGDDFITYNKQNSIGTRMKKSLWAQDINDYKHNYTFYSPLTNKNNSVIPNDSSLNNNKYIFNLLGEEVINDILCYHIKMNILQTEDTTNYIKATRVEYNFWINKKDYIPIQYTYNCDVVMNNDTMQQFEKFLLLKYELNNLKDTSLLGLSSIPSHVKLNDYKPYKRPDLLPKDTIAPSWSLSSVEDKTVSLSDFKGKLVLIDFFYKSCAPCILALPTLQKLHEKYNNKGLIVIGINPYDTKEKDKIDKFLAKHKITYTVLLNGLNVAHEYNVSGYPTMYLIDKKGKIIYSIVGFGEESEKELEKIIIEKL